MTAAPALLNIAPMHLLEQRIDNLLLHYVTSVSANLSALLGAVALAGLTVYYLMLALSFARGEVSEPLGRLLKDGLGQLLICLVVLGGAYQATVVGFLQSLQADLIAGVTVGQADSVGRTLDLLFTRQTVQVDGRTIPMFNALFLISVERSSRIGFPDISYLLGGILVAGTFGLLSFLCLLPAILAKIGLSLMLAVGPVFVLLLLWPATRSYFSAWLSATLGFVLTTALVAMVCTLAPQAFREVIQQALQGAGRDEFNPVGMGTAILAVGIGLGFTALHVSQKGAHLAGGGIAMDSKGIMGTIVQALLMRAFSQSTATRSPSPSSISPGSGNPSPGAPGASGTSAGASTRLGSILAGLQSRGRGG